MERAIWPPLLGLLLLGCPRSPEPNRSAPAAPPSAITVPSVAADAATPAIVASPPPPPLADRVELGDVERYTFGIAADATHVYWADYHGGGGVYRARKDGGGSERLADAVPFARDIAVDDRFVYVAASSGPPGAIMRVAKTGGVVEAFAASQWNPEHVLVHGGRVLWDATPPGVFLSAAPAGGAAPMPVITARVILVALHGEELVWIDELGRLSRSPVAGGAAVTVATLGSVPKDLAADDRFAYIADAGVPVMPKSRPCPKGTPCPIATSAPSYPTGSVFAIPLGGGPRVQIARDLDGVHHLGIDATYAYVSSSRGLQRVRKDGAGTIETVSPTSSSASRLLVSGGRLFFQDGQKMISQALHP